MKGYVIVEVKGYSLEKFMNLILHQKIPVWDAKYEDGNLYFTTMAKDFKRIKPYAKKSRCRARIKMKKGLPFLSFRYRKRKLLIGGSLLFIGVFYFLSSFVFQIEVIGNKNVQETDVIEVLKKTGFGTGKFKNQLDLRQAEEILSTTYDEIVWVGIHWEGTKMVVQIAEAVPKPKIHQDEEACHLIAKRDGLITYIVTDQGMPLVKKGDTVTKGSVLVSGQIQLEDEQGTFYYTTSKATIRAKTGYTLEASIPTFQLEKNYTKEVSTKWTVRIFDHQITLWNPKVVYENYDTLITIKQLSLTKALALPFYIQKEERVEYLPSTVKIDLQHAKDLLQGALYSHLRSLLEEEAKVLIQEISYKEEGQNLKAKLNALVEEEITKVSKIDTSASQANKPVIEGENE